MLVGWGGNNGSTLTASIIANRDSIKWQTKHGVQTSNYYGSIMLASTTKIGIDSNGEDVFIPLSELLPMCEPNNLGMQ